MTPVSNVNTSAARPLSGVEGTLAASRIRQSGGDQGRPAKPVMDEYVPEEKKEPCGRYWLGRDEEGQPKIYFDDPERAADAPEPPKEAPKSEKPARDKEAKGPEKGGEKEERCVGSTDKVDREIERLKKKKEELEQQLNTETDEAKIKSLKKQLEQIKRELSAKDNDAYRKQHSTFTRLS